MASFGYPKFKDYYFWNLHDNVLKLKVHFERKLILIQQLDVYIYIRHFVDGHKISCL